MAKREPDPFASLSKSERERLDRLFVGLREKLLDLTKRNRMLNYSLGARSRRHLQFVDEVPEEIYERLVTENAALDLRPLPEPDDIPSDEKTEEFTSALKHAKNTDIEYLTSIRALESTGHDNDHSIMQAERKLRERVRAELGMPLRPHRAEINRAEYARTFEIEPNPELPKKATKKSHTNNRLQTLKFPDELEGAAEKISDDARSAEQEMGLSTLFLAFGFLEWYESDASDKKCFAPLLLLPVKLESRKTLGKFVYSISATAGAAESNLSLQKHLERSFGRKLSDFEPEDEESSGSIEAYLSQVEKTVRGLSRWRVCRWLVLGHFAFGRLAMYADLATDNWKTHPAGHKLVQSILKGTDGSNGSALPSIPDDYSIDEPEVERIAPYLIYDADASQHSALIDVVKGSSLVIQGPPGTGKSQTITNIIANALTLGKTVLFLAEKQAALEVVKRRLDQVKLGVFCLQCHSDKSSSKQVIAAIKQRLDAGFGNAHSPVTTATDKTWQASRQAIAAYLKALHAPDKDGRTPFRLMWESIRGRSLYPKIVESLKEVALPNKFYKDPEAISTALGRCEIYAGVAQSFSESYGHPAQSAWVHCGIDSLPTYESSALLESVDALKTVANDLRSLIKSEDKLVSCSVTELKSVMAITPKLLNPPSGLLLGKLTAVDLLELENALSFHRSVRAVLADLGRRTDLSRYSTSVLSDACDIVKKEPGIQLLALSPLELTNTLTQRVADSEKLLSLVEDIQPATALLGLDNNFVIGGLEAVARCVIIISSLRPEQQKWFGSFRGIDDSAFAAARSKWTKLVSAEAHWRTRITAPPEHWLAAKEIRTASKILARRNVSKILAKLLGFEIVARAITARLGFNDDSPPTSQELEQLASHVEELDSFLHDNNASSLLPGAWRGLDTPFDEIAVALKVRSFLLDKLKGLQSGDEVSEQALRLPPAELQALAQHKAAANSFYQRDRRLTEGTARLQIKEIHSVLERDLVRSRAILAIDQDRKLSSIALAVSQIAEIGALRQKKDDLTKVLESSSVGALADELDVNDDEFAITQRAIEWIKDIRNAGLSDSLRDKLLGSNVADVCVRLRYAASKLSEPINKYNQYVENLKRQFGFSLVEPNDINAVCAELETLQSQRGQLSEYLGLQAQRGELVTLGLGSFLDKIDQLKLNPIAIPSVLEVILAERRSNNARRAEAVLAQAAGATLEANRHAFCERDKRKIELDRTKVRTSLLPAKPQPGNNAGPRKTWTEMALIKNELDKQQRFVPLRALFKRAHRSLQALMPCFMMSPLSLAKFLPAGQIEFDIAVIDEASQLKPEDALGGLLRAEQIVVVGDPKQLPPTDFFNRATAATGEVDDDDEYEDVDDESILEACQKAFGQVRRLKWHYRSRCESLIAFSNREFYENKLITFPMSRPGSFSIDLVRVDGVYHARQNVSEALRVAEEAIAFMRNYAKQSEADVPTIGIVAVNVEQRDLIRDEIFRLSTGDELVEEYRAKVEQKGEPFFVKNLENVQGDERDFILISLTYGREAGAKALKQRFGPINGKQGHRRLNVLFSRARQRIGLFTSFGSQDVTPSEHSHEGVRVLQRYLEYAEGSGRAPVENTGSEVDSDFEAEVADRLRAKGYKVDYQVGVSGYRIDLGVRNPDKPETFLAGIECDGAQYHSSKSARDRDRIRQQILEGLGWKLLRVWSTDWFENANQETQKLIQRLEKLRTESHAQPDMTYRFSDDEGVDASPNAESVAAPIAENVEQRSTLDSDADSSVMHSNNIDVLGTHAGSQTALKKLTQALREFRDGVIAKEMMEWEPERSILREGMIETFATLRLKDPDQWFIKIPQYQRQNTNPIEKRRYLDRICEIVGRTE